MSRLVLVGLALAVVGVSTTALGPNPAAAQQPSLLFYQNSQDQTPSIDVDLLTAGPKVTAYLGASAGNARNIQADGDDDLMWYADTAGNLRSVVISTGQAGALTVPDALVQGANPGAGRHFSIDPFENLLYVSITDDSVQIIDTDLMESVGSIGTQHFAGAAVGALRHTAIDSVNRLLYYASTDNSIRSFSLDQFDQAGPTFNPVGAIAGGLRHLTYDPNTELLWYSQESCSVASVDTVTEQAGPSIAANAFTDCVGAGRIITMSYQVLPEPASLGSAAAALAALSWLVRRRQQDAQ